MIKYDSHTHTSNSLDSSQNIEGSCLFAIENGISGITVSDHADIYTYESSRSYERIKSSVKDAERMREKYAGRLKIFKSVELGDMYADRRGTEQLRKICDYDVLLGSVHAVPYKDITDYYSQVDFGREAFPKDKLLGFLGEYFSLVSDMIEKDDIDVVCHLTCPMRYIRQKYGRDDIELAPFSDRIEEILKAIIKRDLALEVNASSFLGKNDKNGFLMPDGKILKRYIALGGSKITLGSDAHVASNIARRFDEVAEILTELGFKEYCYFENRRPVYVPLG